MRARYIQHLIEDGQAEPAITADDSLRVDSGERYDVILTNPPCGEKSSFGMVNEEGD